MTIKCTNQPFLKADELIRLEQNYNNKEYIIIDGGSTDGSIDIIKKYEDQIDYWISEPDNGISDAMNKGIKHCHGELIGIIHADDWYEPDCFKSVAEEYDGSSILYGNAFVWSDGKKEKWITNEKGLKREMTLVHPSVFVPLITYKEYGSFKTTFSLAMDYELFLRFKRKGCRFKKVNAVLSNNRAEGISNRNWLAAYWEVLKAKWNNGIYFSGIILYAYTAIRRIIAAILAKLGLTMVLKLLRLERGELKKSERELINSLKIPNRKVSQIDGDDKLLSILYTNAEAFVFPSNYEDFGMPILEAMAYGCPVICSNTSSLPEVAGDAAVYFKPDSIDNMTEVMEEYITSNKHRQTLIQKGLTRSEKFTWHGCADKTRTVYESCI